MPEKNITETSKSTEPQTKTEKKRSFWSIFSKKRGDQEKPHREAAERFANGFKLGHELGRQDGMREIENATSNKSYWKLTSDIHARALETGLPATYIMIAFLQVAWTLVAWEQKEKK